MTLRVVGGGADRKRHRDSSIHTIVRTYIQQRCKLMIIIKEVVSIERKLDKIPEREGGQCVLKKEQKESERPERRRCTTC